LFVIAWPSRQEKPDAVESYEELRAAWKRTLHRAFDLLLCWIGS